MLKMLDSILDGKHVFQRNMINSRWNRVHKLALKHDGNPFWEFCLKEYLQGRICLRLLRIFDFRKIKEEEQILCLQVKNLPWKGLGNKLKIELIEFQYRLRGMV